MPARANSNWVTGWPGLPPSTGCSAGQVGTRRSPDAPPLSTSFTARGAMRSKPRLAIHPARTGGRPASRSMVIGGIGVRARGVVGAIRLLARGGFQRDLAERHVDVGTAGGRGVDLARAGDRAGGDAARAGGGLRLDGHRRLLNRARGRTAVGRDSDCGGTRPYAGMTRFRFKGHRAAALNAGVAVSQPLAAGLPSVAGQNGVGGGRCQMESPSSRRPSVVGAALTRHLLCIDAMTMKPTNPALAIASIMKSQDKAWLREFRARMLVADAPDIVAAIDVRLAQLGELALRVAIGKPLADLTLTERVHEAVRVYEQFLAYKHGGKRVAAARTKRMIERWGEKEAVRRTVTNLTMSTGLELLAKYGRLECAYEQIILDFPDEFDAATIAKARANLARLPRSPLAWQETPVTNMRHSDEAPELTAGNCSPWLGERLDG